MNIYIGNLSHETTEEDLRRAFEVFGHVLTINIIKDRVTGKSKGFGFMNMPIETEALLAIKGLNGQELKGRKLVVKEARSRIEGSPDVRRKN